MKDIKDVILFQIDWTSKVSKQYSQREMDRLNLGITVEQWIILKIVSESTNLTQKELAKRSFRDPASITRTIDLLEKKNYLVREPVENNRRAYHIRLTSEGGKFIHKNMAFVQSQRDLSTEGITNKELKILSDVLLKIRNNMG